MRAQLFVRAFRVRPTNLLHHALLSTLLCVCWWPRIAAAEAITPIRGNTARSAIEVTPHVDEHITTDVRWRADRVHVIEGVLRIHAGAVLRIDAGTRVLARSRSAVVVDRNGRIAAEGTLYQPIVFSCEDATTATRDCWEGVIVAGNAPVNGGTPTSPAARGLGGSGCAERVDDPFAGAYGGCDAADDSGVLRYVRIEFAREGLRLLGVGRGTRMELVQVHAAGASGITVRGGTVDLQHVMVTGGSTVGIDWSAGWVGRLQHAIVQSPRGTVAALRGRNDAAAPNATPRSAPRLANVTLLGLTEGEGSAPATALALRDGSTAEVRNLLAAGYDVVLDLDGPATCSRVGVDLSISHAVIAGTTALGDPDADGDCTQGAAVEDAVLAQPTIEPLTDVAMVATLLKSGFASRVPDFRAVASVLETRATLPEDDGFFLPSLFVGAVEPAVLLGANLPWHSGWTRDGLASGTVLFGSVRGTVSGTTRGPLNAARIEVGGASTLSAPDGTFALGGLPAGAISLQVTTVPSGCTLPSPTSAVVPGGSEVELPVSVECSEPTITTSGLILTYICANRFRVRNPNDAVLPVSWDVAGVGETGVLSLPARPIGSGFSETFFDTVATGTVRLFYNGTQIQVKANGGFVCAP